MSGHDKGCRWNIWKSWTSPLNELIDQHGKLVQNADAKQCRKVILGDEDIAVAIIIAPVL